MSTTVIASILAPILVFLAAVFGVYMKRRTERQAAIDQKLREEAERKAKAEADKLAADNARIQQQFDQMQETIDTNRVELRAMTTDLNAARDEITRMWSRMSAMRRAFDDAEAHIADVHRWDENGRNGSMPEYRKVVLDG